MAYANSQLAPTPNMYHYHGLSSSSPPPAFLPMIVDHDKAPRDPSIAEKGDVVSFRERYSRAINVGVLLFLFLDTVAFVVCLVDFVLSSKGSADSKSSESLGQEDFSIGQTSQTAEQDVSTFVHEKLYLVIIFGVILFVVLGILAAKGKFKCTFYFTTCYRSVLMSDPSSLQNKFVQL